MQMINYHCLICTGNNYAVSLALIQFNQLLNLEVETSSYWDFYSSCYPIALPDNLQNMQAMSADAMLAQESGMMGKSIKLKMILTRRMFFGTLILVCLSLWL